MARKKFENMTKAEQRVAIAKDVIEQIHAGRIKATRMRYLTDSIGNFPFSSPPTQCHACALGALFMGRFNIVNGGWESLYASARVSCFKRGPLDEFFSIDQLLAIEVAYEEYEVGWCEELIDNDDRLIAIMQNIIDHKGTFKPEVLYEVA